MRLVNDAALSALKPGLPAEGFLRRDRARHSGKSGPVADTLPRIAPVAGVGLEGVEGPEIGAGDKRPLQPGMVVTVEPSVYADTRASRSTSKTLT